MKGDTPVDYAEFQLTPKRTRCELFVSADGFMEKLASGFVKPFVTQLRAAEAQVSRGNQVIRLEAKSGYEKQGNTAWFCKGTIERFVRFVSTPEVIERVKTIEDELTQLEQVRSALVNTFAQTPDWFPYCDATTGHHRTRDGTNTSVPRRFSTDKEDNEPDASKKELLRAMEARLNALHQEQNMAFSRANAAGFDNNNIADLMTFAEHFGADRLHDACAHFLALLRKKTIPKGGQECTNSPTFETPSDASVCTFASAFGTNLVSKDEASVQGAKRKLDFGANKPQANKSGGAETKGIDPSKRELGQNGGSTITTTDQMVEATGSGMFFARLQQMAHQVDARSKEDFGWQAGGEKELSFQGSDKDADSSSQNNLSNSFLPERSTSLPALRVHTEGFLKQKPSLIEARTAKDEDEVSKEKVLEETCAETEKSKSTQGDAPARRLSVQAAISLFESKKKDSNEPPLRKLTKQESRKSLGEGGNSPSEKSVLKRWSGQTPFSPEANNVQEKKVLEVQQNLELEKVKAPANKVSSSQDEVDASPQVRPDEQARENFKKALSSLLQHDNVPPPVDAPPQVRPDEQARENFKKALSSLLQHDNVQHPDQSSKPKSKDANVQHIKHSSPPIQQPPNCACESNTRLDSKNLSSLGQNVFTEKMEAEKVKSEAATIIFPAKPSMQNKTTTEIKSIPEVKLDDQPVPSRLSIDYNAKPDQEYKDKEVLKIHNTKEHLPKPSQSVPLRSRISTQLSAAVPFERENVACLATTVSEPEQVLGKKPETVKHKEVPAAIDKQTGRNTSFGKTSVQKKMSLVKELPTNLLSSSLDLHMQALVQMVEHQYTNMSFNGIEIANEQRGEQRGRFYDQYAKLREAKLRREHPAKRAEREAKLKSMQETLERRKAEMETKAVRLSRKKVRDARAADLGGERMPRNMGLTAPMVEQKDLKNEDDDTDQEEYNLKSQDQNLDSSNPTSPVSTPRSSKSRSSSLKLRAPARAVPSLSKSVSGPRNSARGGASSPKPTLKNPGAPSQGKQLSLSTSVGEATAVKSLLNVKDVARSSLIRTGGSARVHPRVNVPPSEAATPIDDLNSVAPPGNIDKKEPKYQPSLTRKNVASIAVSRSLPTDAGMFLGSPKDQLEGATDALDSRTPRSPAATQEAKPFLRKGRGIGPGAGPGIMKQKASTLVESFKNFDEETSKEECKQDEVDAEFEDTKSTVENSLEEANDGRVVQDQDGSSSGVETMPTVIEESASSPSSRPSTGPTESGEMEPLDDLPESTSESEKPVSGTVTSHITYEMIGPGVVEATPQGSFLQLGNHKQKEGSFILSDLLSQKNSDPVSNTAAYVTSSVSFREASLLPHGQIGSPFLASVSHPYSSMLQRGAVSGRFSPPRGDLPSSSPALWNVTQSSKYMQEGELVHSTRRLTGHQKQTSMLPLPPKEPSKGFKRLLHFGRKSRTSEATTDCVSVSTTSEGDEDADDVRESSSQLSDEVLQKIRMQKRGFEYGNVGDQLSYTEQDTSQFFGSAIPPPPANFKLREEHLSGGNSLKAPRSFFSLSSFRSKGSEGKSR